MMKKEKTICFIMDSPVLSNLRKTCLLDQIKQSDYKLILCDVSYVIDRNSFEANKTGLLDDSYAPIYRLYSYLEIKEFLHSLPKAVIVIVRMRWGWSTWPLFRWMESLDIKYGYMSLNEWDVSGFSPLPGGAVNVITSLNLKRIWNAAFIRMPRVFLLRHGASFIVTNTQKRVELYIKRYAASVDSKVLVLHSNVYEEALEISNIDRLVKEPYCVWLDTYTPYHSDFAGTGIIVNPENYYSSLRKFFSFIEHNYNIRVIIAAHPKADYGLHKMAYGKFEVISGDTCLLCRDAQFVMTCASQSVLYPLLYKKPIVFLIQDILKECRLFSHIKAAEYLSHLLGSALINIDHFQEGTIILNDCLSVNHQLYEERIKEWIKHDYDSEIGIGGESCIQEFVDFMDELIHS